LVATESVYRLAQLIRGLGAGALLRLAPDEDIGKRVALEVIAKADFRVGIAWGNVDLIDASTQRGFDQTVRSILIQYTKRECTKRDDSALVTSSSQTSRFHPSLLNDANLTHAPRQPNGHDQYRR
jgi:hypothetical protein